MSQYNPSFTERQRQFMCAEYGRKKAGKRTRTKMSRRDLRDFCRKPVVPKSKRKGKWMKKVRAYRKTHARRENWQDRLEGGRADTLTPAAFKKNALHKGMRHELEHTHDRQLAMEIAMDHLAEDPQYYKKLAKVEGKRHKKNPHLTSGKWRYVGLFKKSDIKAVKRILQIHGIAHKVTANRTDKLEGRGYKELYVTRPLWDTAYRAITRLFEGSMAA